MKARLVIALCGSVLLAVVPGPLLSQQVEGGGCRPVSERKTEVGCWILASDPVGVLSEPQAFWHLDVYQTRAAALAVKRQEKPASKRRTGKSSDVREVRR